MVAARLARVGHVDGRQLDVEDLGQRFGREQVGLAAPLEVGHEVGLGRGSRSAAPSGELVRQREGEVVALDRVEVDRLPGDLAVAVVELGEVAEADDGVAHAPRGEVHHRVADVADLDVEHGDDAAVLRGGTGPSPTRSPTPARATRRVAAQPPQAELDERIGVRLHRPVDALVARHAEGARTRSGRRGAHDAGVDERPDVERVQPGEDVEVVVDHRVALVVGRLLEVVAARRRGPSRRPSACRSSRRPSRVGIPCSCMTACSRIS